MSAPSPGAIERSEIAFGRTRIAYQIRRSARRGTVSIAIDPDHGVLVTAPAPTTVARLDRVVHERGVWILRNLRDRGALASPNFHEFVSGETFRYLGRGYRLKVIERSAEAAVALRAGWLHVQVRPQVDTAARSAQVRKRLAAWFRQLAVQRLPGLVARWAARLAVKPAAVFVREAPKRWGSCDGKGNIRLNWRIVQAAPRLIEYVVVHELTHLRHGYHSPDFWAAVGKALPDYDSRRAELKRVGAGLVW